MFTLGHTLSAGLGRHRGIASGKLVFMALSVALEDSNKRCLKKKKVPRISSELPVAQEQCVSPRAPSLKLRSDLLNSSREDWGEQVKYTAAVSSFWVS